MTKRKIGLIELYGHNEVLYILYRLLKNDFEISVFTTHSILKDAEDYFDGKLNNWYDNPPQMSNEQFIKSNLALLNQQDILIFVTLISSFRFFANTYFKAKTICIIHNVNTMLIPRKSLWIEQFLVSDIFRLLRSIILRDNFYKKKLLEKIDFISYPSKNLTAYSKEISSIHNHKIIDPIPFSFFEKYIEREEQTPIIISIPGSINKTSRDYELVYFALKEVLPKLRKKIVLQFLGSAKTKYGEDVINKFTAIENEYFQITFFEKPLSQKEFDSYLQKTDFLILPIKKYIKFGIYKEEYGVSNISGGMNDLLRFGIPALVSSDYKIEEECQKLASHFRNKMDLKLLLEDWIQTSKFIRIREKAMPFLEKNNEAITREKIIRFLTKEWFIPKN